MGAQDNILLVEDEADLAELVSFNLTQLGYHVNVAPDGETALSQLQHSRPDLVVLDVMLPDMSGIEICRRIRKDAATERLPVLMLTAKGEEIDRVVGFEVGADDYMVKPFSPRELGLRIAAILRRSLPPSQNGETSPQDKIEIGQLRMDLPAHTVTVRGQDVPLTTLEFKLLLFLATQPGRVQSRDTLLEKVWEYAPGVGSRTVDTHVKRLREKLDVASDYIETVRGVGYRMRSDIE